MRIRSFVSIAWKLWMFAGLKNRVADAVLIVEDEQVWRGTTQFVVVVGVNMQPMTPRVSVLVPPSVGTVISQQASSPSATNALLLVSSLTPTSSGPNVTVSSVSAPFTRSVSVEFVVAVFVTAHAYSLLSVPASRIAASTFASVAL